MTPLLVSVEGVNGVGKTYLTRLVVPHFAGEILALEGFTERSRSEMPDLGREMIRALMTESGGDPFLRSGHPGTETLLLLAIKAYDWERYCRPALASGQIVIEGRSVHSTAIYQALIMNPGNDRKARAEAAGLLELAATWRPLPDLTLLVLDQVESAIARLERRDGRHCTPEERWMHHRADRLYRQMATADPGRFEIVDLAREGTHLAVEQMVSAIRRRVADEVAS